MKKPSRAVLAPALVLGIAVTTGGWFLQRGVEQEANVYFQVRLFEEVVDRVSDHFVDDVDRGALYQNAIEGLLDGLDDPNTSFIEAADYETFRIRTQGDYGGVGLEIVEQDGFVTVVSPIPGTPAARAGIRAGDRFVSVEGEDAVGWDVDEVADRLRGEPGSEVDVEILRIGVDQPIPFTLRRAEIHLKAVPFATLIEGDVGYVPLQVFREASAGEVRAAVDSLVDAGATGIVLDLRDNPGGLLEAGIGVSDLFLGEDVPVVETRGRAQGQSQAYRASDPEAFVGLPVVALVNESSASASEIVAGALQDHDRGVVVGNTSFGKGSVQTLFRLSGGNVLRLTTAKWYTPSGRSIQMSEDRKRERMLGENGTLALSGRLVDRPDTVTRPTFRSAGGRTLYGGGGITPDVVILPDTLTSEEQRAVRALFREAGVFNLALFNFATAYVQEHPGTRPDFILSDGDVEAFYRTLSERGLRADRETLERAGRFIRYQLGREIALQAGGESAEFARIRRDDVQLRKALELLEAASEPGELLRVAASDPAAVRPGAERDSPEGDPSGADRPGVEGEVAGGG